MGDRVSIQFVNGKEKSVVLFNHWGGRDFPLEASNYIVNVLPKRLGEKSISYSDPGSRREPNTIMVDFVSYLFKGEVVRSSFYFGASEDDGDNSDNGHFIIDAITGDIDRDPCDDDDTDDE